jgi:hypothetical protein
LTDPKIVQEVIEALQCFGQIKTEDMGGGAIKVEIPDLQDRNEEAFRVYVYRKGKKLFLSDAGLITYSLKTPQLDVHMSLIQQLMRTYGLIVLQDGCVLDRRSGPLSRRITSFIQAWAAVDGIVRMWNMPKEKK